MQNSPDVVVPSTIDIIIPVYRGLAETRACIESVLASTGATPHEIVVVDDASPAREISDYLASLAQQQKITLLINAQNMLYCSIAIPWWQMIGWRVYGDAPTRRKTLHR
jgi:O-antigen biosynthesis protein